MRSDVTHPMDFKKAIAESMEEMLAPMREKIG
jgi:hypothetical protein